MSFSIWHWLIVVAITAFAFRGQLFNLILYLTDPGRAFKDRLGVLNAKDREDMIRKQQRIRLELKRKAWLILVAGLVLIFVWKVMSFLPAHSQP